VLATILVATGIGSASSASVVGVIFAAAYFTCAAALYAPALFKLFREGKSRELKEVFIGARLRVENLVDAWNKLCADDRFDQLYRQLEETKQRLIEMPGQRQASIKALAENAASRQRDAYLSLFMIHKARLPWVRPEDIALLASFGIDSADDVLRNLTELPLQIPNKARAELKRWAHACAQNFQFDPTRGADPADLREIDELLAQQQEQLLAKLDKGAQQLQTLTEAVEKKRRHVERDLKDALSRLEKVERQVE
jgi:DNA-binding helix-hairpin-helix protein with protein kinase domain